MLFDNKRQREKLKKLFDRISSIRGMIRWRRRGYLENSPQSVKQNIFVRYGIANAQWVETGTYKGTTTNFLASRFSHVHSIEPGLDLFDKALRRFKGRNVELYNGVSEDVLPELLPKLSGDINFWLDGHYSAGETFKGDKDCPVEDELNAIEKNLINFSKVSILIDDVRCFLPTQTSHDYPSIDYLVDWARKNKFGWRIEHDILILQKH